MVSGYDDMIGMCSSSTSASSPAIDEGHLKLP